MSKTRSKASAAHCRARGSSKDRARRLDWLMREWEADIEGVVRCFRCGLLLLRGQVTIDRIVPGALGGGYQRNNIRPACLDCNHLLGELLHSRLTATREADAIAKAARNAARRQARMAKRQANAVVSRPDGSYLANDNYERGT